MTEPWTDAEVNFWTPRVSQPLSALGLTFGVSGLGSCEQCILKWDALHCGDPAGIDQL